MKTPATALSVKLQDSRVGIIRLRTSRTLLAFSRICCFLSLRGAFLGVRAGNSPVELCTKFAGGFLSINASALVVVGYHDGLCCPGADDTTGVVKHREVEVEAYLLTMMPAVACNPYRKDNIA